MYLTFVALAFSAGASARALSPRQNGECCFPMSASGGVSGVVGELGDGQLRVGPGAVGGRFCIQNGGITDSLNRGCILTYPTTQFQCDVGAVPNTGFSISSSSQILLNGSPTFYACPLDDKGNYNIYSQALGDMPKCVEITLTSDNTGCAGSGGNAPVPTSQAPIVTPGMGPALVYSYPPTYATGASTSTETQAASSQGQAAVTTCPPGGCPTTSVYPAVPYTPSSPAATQTGVVVPSSNEGSDAGQTSAQAPGVDSPSSGAGESSGSASQPAGQSASSGSQSSSDQSPGCAPGSGQPCGQASSSGGQSTGGQSPGQSSGDSSGSSSQPSGQAPGAASAGSSGSSTQPSGQAAGSSCPATGFPTGSSSQPSGQAPSSGSQSPSEGSGSSGEASSGSSTQPSGSGSGTSCQGAGCPSGSSSQNTGPGSGSSDQSSPSGQSPSGNSGSSSGSPSQAAPGSGSSGGSTGSSPAAPATSGGQTSFSCPPDLSGHFEFPHGIQIVSASDNTVVQSQSYFGEINDTVSTVYTFDIPYSLAGMTCTSIFLFPQLSQMETSSFNETNGSSGALKFELLSGPLNTSPTVQYTNVIDATPGNSYVVGSYYPCHAGQQRVFEVSSVGSYSLSYFQDYNPSPIGLYIRAC